jgi:CDP-diacylglycerol--serine O-phosphatidyltransferase
VPRALWVRRRRATDSPRPAGRRWAGRLRQRSSLARQAILIKVTRRGRGSGAGAVADSRHLVLPADLDPAVVAPVSPALPPLSYTAAPAASGSDHTGPRSIPLLPGDRTLTRRVRFALVNLCTLSSLFLGMSAIFLSMQGHVRLGALCLIGCVVFDGLDGALARKLGVASPFGAQMDSLADMCSFGIAAPIVVYSGLHGSAPTAAVAAACALVAACAAIRLARFNVSPKDGRFFCGVPTTMAAAVLGLSTLIGLDLPGLVAVGSVGLLALAMVSSFPYAKLARIIRLPVWLFAVPVIGFLLDYRTTFLSLVAVYLVSGPLLWLRQRQVARA